MYLLGLDFETTGLDVERDLVTEVGAVLWDWERKQPVLIHHAFVNWGLPIPEEVVEKTGVLPEYVEKFGNAPDISIAELFYIEKNADIIVAHNGSTFDRPIYRNWIKHLNNRRQETELQIHQDPRYVFDEGKLWIDTQLDLEIADGNSRRLSYMAADHGFLNPFAHRAVFDVLTMMRILSQYDLDAVIYSARQPMVVLQAMVSFDEKEKAKEKKFYWDAPNKRWIKNLKQHHAVAFAATCDFRTRTLLV